MFFEGTSGAFRDHPRTYFRCSICDLIFAPVSQLLSPQDEKAEYDRHQNSPSDQGYRRFLSPVSWCSPLASWRCLGIPVLRLCRWFWEAEPLKNIPRQSPGTRVKGHPADAPTYLLVRPLPGGDFFGVGAMLVGIGEVLDDGILHPFLHMGGRRAQLGHPVNHINYQIKAVNLIENR
jgi:hypothetical protein